MKTPISILTAFWILAISSASLAQTYVNAAATGNNDGSSWADAYTELATALDNYNAGDEIWVAAGTYHPQQPSAWPGDPKRTFYIYQDVKIYGGFDGTETMLSERDPSANLTVLSGDLDGNDITDDFNSNRDDNVINVVYVDSLVSTSTVIDGFTISGGHADIDDAIFPNKRGGGIFSWGPVQVSNCIFQQNYTIWHGAGIYYWQVKAAGGRVENCVFQNNKCLVNGAGITVARVSGLGVLVENCQFNNNEAARGGGIYFLNSFAVANNCEFTDNGTELLGGGIFLFYNEFGDGNQKFSITNCSFQGNSSGLSGGGVTYNSVNAIGNQVMLSNCQFTENSSANGGGFWYYSEGTTDGNLTIESTDFLNSEAVATSLDQNPDAAGLGFEYVTTASQRDTIRILDCTIQDNTTNGVTGGIFYVHSLGSENHLQVDQCEIVGNIEGSGLSVGGMAIAEGGESTSVQVQNTLFDGNSGPLGQGFGVSAYAGVDPPAARNIELVNCLFTNHNNLDAGTAVLATDRQFVLTNCTFSGNQSALLGHIEEGTYILQNTILDGTPTLVSIEPAVIPVNPISSLGGNLVSDEALDIWLTSTDQSNVDPLLEMGTFQPSVGSPAVDAGVLLGPATATDFAGNNRIQGGCIDIGAIESPFDAGTACQLPPRLYVDQDATGNNDGSSWANAYTTLHDALENYNRNDEIWVAEGTYTPQEPSAWPGTPKNTFYLYQDAQLYGGFNGTETMLSQRDPATNVTILSGDLNGDDIPDDFESNRDDNATNLMFLTQAISPVTIIDGFTIASGHADGDEAIEYNIRGGGMWCLGSPQIRDCRITQNYTSNFGAGIFLIRGMAAQTVIEDCVFDKNRAGIIAGGLEVATLNSDEAVQINNCQFIGNIADNSGGGLIIFESSASFTDCQFTENISSNAAGAMYFFNDTQGALEVTVRDCIFERNTSNHGGAFYHFSDGPGNDNFLFDNCDFIENEAITSPNPDFFFPDGGAMGFQYLTSNNPANDSIRIIDCNFERNTAERLGGGIAYFNSNGTGNYFSIKDCEFSENTATNSGGGICFAQFGDTNMPSGTQLDLIDSDFEDNTAGNGGGLSFFGNVGGEGNYRISNCDFDGNVAETTTAAPTPIGGAIYVSFAGSGFQGNLFSIDDCLVENNTADFGGGGIFYYGILGFENQLLINDCEVSGNSASLAGGVGLVEGGINNSVLVQNSFFNQNESAASMAVGVGLDFINPGIISAVNPYTEFSNCLFSNHGDGSGTAVVAEVLGEGVEANFTNCTFAFNEAPLLGTDISTVGGQFNLQNNILSDDGFPSYISGSAGSLGTVNSLGGNLVTDNALDAFLNSTDQPGTDPIFQAGLIQLASNSPAVDAGILPSDPPATDFFGNARIKGSCIDIGAAESSFVTGNDCLVVNTREELASSTILSIYPNPAYGMTNIAIENDWTGELSLRIVNALGQEVTTRNFEKFEPTMNLELNVSDLPKGIYQVMITNGEAVAVGGLIRQ